MSDQLANIFGAMACVSGMFTKDELREVLKDMPYFQEDGLLRRIMPAVRVDDDNS